jgi:hypothetical protein
MWRLFPLLLSIVALTLPVPVQAAPRKPLQVLTLQSEDSVREAQALTAALKAAITRSGRHTLGDGDFSLEVMALALACSDPPDGSCLGRIAAKIKSDQFVWGTLENDAGKLLVQLRLWRRGGEGSQVSARYGKKTNGEALDGVADKLLAELDGVAPAATLEEVKASDDWGGEEPAPQPEGDLVIYADDVNGQVVVNGHAHGKIKNGYARIALPAGQHEVLVRASGYYEAIAEVEVEARRRAQVTLHPERRDRARQKRGARQSEESNGGAYVAIGVGTVLVASGVYAVAKLQTLKDAGDDDPERRTYDALQYLGFGLGGVAIGTGAVILLTGGGSSEDEPEKDEARSSVRAEPRVSVGKTGAEVGVRMSF